MSTLIAKYLKTHGTSNNSTDYSPTFVNQDARDANSTTGGVGYYTPIYFGIHNPSGTAQTVTVWTVTQGTSGSGVSVYLAAGATFYATVAKLTVSANVTLLGAPYNPNYL